jgi:hypothetical protein
MMLRISMDPNATALHMSTGPVSGIPPGGDFSPPHVSAEMRTNVTPHFNSAPTHAQADLLDMLQIALDDDFVRALTVHLKQIAD